jgi:hypothetical protein
VCGRGCSVVPGGEAVRQLGADAPDAAAALDVQLYIMDYNSCFGAMGGSLAPSGASAALPATGATRRNETVTCV